MDENEAAAGGEVERAAGRGLYKGMAIGFVVMSGVTFASMMHAGAGLVPSLGVAAFAGFWGGPGYGGMLGATVAAVQAEHSAPSIRRLPDTSTTTSSLETESPTETAA